MKKLLLLISSLYAAGVLFAQNGSVSGIVTGDGGRLELAGVSLLKTAFGVNTDSTGHWVLSNVPPGKYQLRVNYVGFENYQDQVVVEAGKNTTVNTELVPLTAKLKEVVVTGTLKEVTKLESSTAVDVYTPKYFQRNPVSNLFDGLYNIPGLFADVDNGVANTTDVQINGLEGNYTMYLIDGVPALTNLAGVYALNSFPMSVIDKVEVVKGAASTLYGSEAIGGVINIKTRNPLTAPKLSLNVSLTSMLEADLDIAFKYKMGKATGLLVASGTNFNMRWDLDQDGFLDIPLINRASVYNKWALPRTDNKIASIYARYLFEDRFGGDKKLASGLRGSNQLYGEAITTHQWQVGFQYQLPVAENVMFMVDYSEHRQHAFYGFNEYKGVQQSGFTQLTWNKKIDPINEFLIGASYRLQNFEDNTSLSADTATEYPHLAHIGAMFFQHEFTIAKYHKLLFGARIEYSNRSNFIISPRFNYKWNSKDGNHIIRAGVGTGYRLPNVINEGIGAMNGSRQVVIAEELRPEECVSSNLNYTRVQRFNGGLLNIDASVFYTHFFNFIEPDYDDDPELIVYDNSQGATAVGGSINADFTFNYPLKVGVGLIYTYVYELEVDDDGEVEKEIPEHQPPFIATFYLSYNFPGPQLSIDWTGNFVAPMLLATVPDDFRPEKSPFYTIQNIQLTKKFRNGLELYMGLKNFFNFVQKDPILRPFDPFNRMTGLDNPNNYRFDTTYGFTSTQGIKGFIGLRYTLQ